MQTFRPFCKDEKRKQTIAHQLLKYCKLDTLATSEIEAVKAVIMEAYVE
ncbi:hypothetical protein [Arachidicoccus sp.]